MRCGTNSPKIGEKPWHIEGADTRRWVLMDYVDFVVHIFREEARDFYALERLWGDAERTDFPRWGSARGSRRERPLNFRLSNADANA